MSRRKTPHQTREGRRNRRALDRAIIRAVREMTWGQLHNAERIVIDRESTIELIGLCLARRRL